MTQHALLRQIAFLWSIAVVFTGLPIECNDVQADERVPEPDRSVVYKRIGEVELRLHLFEPKNSVRSRSAIVFFFGGGWVGGTPSQFYPQCDELAKRGMLAMSADYRVKSRHGATPFECVQDGKSAIRWVRLHADELQIDPNRIIASGGSAGGHVAACTVCVEYPEDNRDTITPYPAALILFNPVIDTSPYGFGHKRFGSRYRELSPLAHVRPGLPPTLILQGLADTTTPPEGHREFQRRMIEKGNECQLRLYPGKGHGFFNQDRGDGSGYEMTTKEMFSFLESHGYLLTQQTKEN